MQWIARIAATLIVLMILTGCATQKKRNDKSERQRRWPVRARDIAIAQLTEPDAPAGGSIFTVARL